MKVGYFQSCPEFGEVKKNLDQFTSQLDAVDCEVLVLPELAFSGYQFVSREEALGLSEPVPDGPTTQTCLGLARQHHMYLVVGLPEREGDQCYNSAIAVGPSGFLGCYRKTHLFFEEDLVLCAWQYGFSGLGYWPGPNRRDDLF